MTIERRANAFTIIELLIVVAIMGVLLMMALPNFYRMRLTTRKAICLNNLRQIEGAVDRWVFENDINEGYVVTSSDEADIYSYLRSGLPVCPSGGEYTISVVGSYPQVTCSMEGHGLAGE